MSPEQWARAKALFSELSERDATGWPAALAAETDPLVAGKVRRLLHNHRSDSDFLQDSPAATLTTKDPLIGRMLGPFRIERLLGEGGSGRVYLAQRADVGGQAAVKLLRGRFADADATRRFHAEQSILARLVHANIARLLQVGIAEDGTPWLAMEYVEGRPFRDATAELPVRQRVQRVIKLLGAVEYAHHQLVVHRDIKPGNILVDAQGEPRLLDFGIAKRLDYAGSELTHTEIQPRTPAYSAPEQIRGEPISVATDVYAIGVLLYEVLAGCKPWSESGNKLETAILAGDPPLPSSRASERDRSALRGDLDAIVLQAMQVVPQRRYSSAASMSADLQRYLDRRPVAAQRQTVAYRSGRFLLRNQRLVAAALLGVALLSFAWIRESRLRAEASLEAQKSAQVADFMLHIFDAGDSLTPGFTITKNSTVMDLMARGAARLDELDSAPLVRADLAHKMGQVYWGLSEYSSAEKQFSTAIALREKFLGESDATAESHLMLGRVYSRTGRYQKMLKTMQTSHAMRLKVLGPDDPGTTSSLHRVGVAYYYLGDLDRADGIFIKAIGAWRAQLPDSALRLADSLTMHAHASLGMGEFEVALQSAEEALRLRKPLLPADHNLITEGQSNVATSLFSLGRLAEAIEIQRKVIAIDEASMQSDHFDLVLDYEHMALYQLANGQLDQAGSMIDKAVAMAGRLNAKSPNQGLLDRARQTEVEVMRALSELQAALDLGRDVLRTRSQDLAPSHTYVIATRSVLADLLRRLGQTDEADRQMRLALDGWLQHPGGYTRELVENMNHFADAGRCGWLDAIGSMPMSERMFAAIERNRLVCGR